MRLASATGMRRALAQIAALAVAACSPAQVVAQVGDSGNPGAGDAGPGGDAADGADAYDPCAPVAVDGAVFDDAGCANFLALPCGMPADASLYGCSPDIDTCQTVCGPNLLLRCGLAVVSCDPDAGLLPDASTIVECSTCIGDFGRRPRGLVAARLPGAQRELGAYFAAMAYLEAASVPAFRELGRELRAHGAPARLVRAAARAEGDERRHARAARRLARRFGGHVPRVRVARGERRESLVSLLEHDVVEGCVAETFAALVASWQAARAGDVQVARTFGRIAEDEARHAALSWAVLEWGASRVDAAARARLLACSDRALREIERRTESGVGDDVAQVAGHPSPPAARALAHAFTRVARAELLRLSS